MTRSRKLGKAYFFRWISFIPCEEHVGFSKISTSGGSSAVYASKSSSFLRNTASFAANPPFSRWISSIRLGERIVSSMVASCSSCCTVFVYPVKASPFSLSGRGFCNGRGSRDRPRCPRTQNASSVQEAQAALLDYLHCTRGLDFDDAEHVSKNSPIFLHKLLEKVQNDLDIGKEVARFLRYHPINEFEPFFESLGLKSSQFNTLLPKDLTFLSEDGLLLDNYHVLCNYGVARGKIGKVFREAAEIFRYGHGVMASKLQAYEVIGLSKTSIVNIVSSSPSLLIGDVNREFVEVLEELENMGIDHNWIGANVSEKKDYSWGRMIWLLHFFHEVGLSKMEVGMLIKRCPGLLLDGSGKMTFQSVGLFSKLGGTKNGLLNLLLQFPDVQISTFVKNVHQGVQFLTNIGMECEDIQKLVHFHFKLLGSCSLMKPGSILSLLAIGRRRLCEIIKEDPYQFLNYTKGSKLEPLPNHKEDKRTFMQKTKFLQSLGFVENTTEMEKAHSIFRGKVNELQQRYEYLMKKGFDPKDITKMTIAAPLVLRQKLEGLKCKVDFLVDSLCFPIEALVHYPRCLQFSVERIKHRFLMYNWLKDEGIVKSALSIGTILACTDEIFLKTYVCRHPKGLEVWDKFKEVVYN